MRFISIAAYSDFDGVRTLDVMSRTTRDAPSTTSTSLHCTTDCEARAAISSMVFYHRLNSTASIHPPPVRACPAQRSSLRAIVPGTAVPRPSHDAGQHCRKHDGILGDVWHGRAAAIVLGTHGRDEAGLAHQEGRPQAQPNHWEVAVAAPLAAAAVGRPLRVAVLVLYKWREGAANAVRLRSGSYTRGALSTCAVLPLF